MHATPSPIRPHGSSAVELKQRLAADQHGEPYLLFRDDEHNQQIMSLGDQTAIAVGRTEAADLVLHWDGEVSRVHALLEQVAGNWTITDDGLSRNGTFVNHERLRGRRKLEDGDTLRFGNTLIAFKDPRVTKVESTMRSSEPEGVPQLTDAQRRVLVSLCKPYTSGEQFPFPPSNQDIASDLVISVDTVKSQLRVLFSLFDLDRAPRTEKRVRLVERALASGVLFQDNR